MFAPEDGARDCLTQPRGAAIRRGGAADGFLRVPVRRFAWCCRLNSSHGRPPLRACAPFRGVRSAPIQQRDGGVTGRGAPVVNAVP